MKVDGLGQGVSESKGAYKGTRKGTEDEALLRQSAEKRVLHSMRKGVK